MWLTHPVLILGVAVLLSAPGRAGIAATEDGRLLSNLQLNKRILLAERRSLFIDDEDYGIMSSGSGDVRAHKFNIFTIKNMLLIN